MVEKIAETAVNTPETTQDTLNLKEDDQLLSEFQKFRNDPKAAENKANDIMEQIDPEQLNQTLSKIKFVMTPENYAKLTPEGKAAIDNITNQIIHTINEFNDERNKRLIENRNKNDPDHINQNVIDPETASQSATEIINETDPKALEELRNQILSYTTKKPETFKKIITPIQNDLENQIIES